MTPFLIAAIACGLVAFLFGILLRPWLDNKKHGSETDQETQFAANAREDRPKIQGNYRGGVPLWLLLTGICILFFVPLLEYIYIELVHYDINRRFFFDGPYFRQIIFGCIFGTFISFWLMRRIAIEQTKRNEQSLLKIVGQEKNLAREADEGATQFTGSADSQQLALYNELPTAIALLIIFLFGVFDADTIARIARMGGNVKLPGGVEFAFGRNESRSSETSVAQLVPPSNAQNSYAPPSVSQGLQSLSELGQTMRRDALIYALSKRLVKENKETGKVALSESSEKSAKCEKLTADDLLARLCTQIELVDNVFVKLANCIIKENEQHLDYMSSGDKILPIAQKLNIALRKEHLHIKQEIKYFRNAKLQI